MAAQTTSIARNAIDHWSHWGRCCTCCRVYYLIDLSWHSRLWSLHMRRNVWLSGFGFTSLLGMFQQYHGRRLKKLVSHIVPMLGNESGSSVLLSYERNALTTWLPQFPYYKYCVTILQTNVAIQHDNPKIPLPIWHTLSLLSLMT